MASWEVQEAFSLLSLLLVSIGLSFLSIYLLFSVRAFLWTLDIKAPVDPRVADLELQIKTLSKEVGRLRGTLEWAAQQIRLRNAEADPSDRLAELYQPGGRWTSREHSTWQPTVGITGEKPEPIKG